MNPKAENQCHCRVTCPMPEGDAYEGDHEITFCSWHSRDGMQPGDRVRVFKDRYPSRLNGGSLVGRKGVIRYIRPGKGTHGLNVDVALDSPLPGDRFYIWFSESALEVIDGRKRR